MTVRGHASNRSRILCCRLTLTDFVATGCETPSDSCGDPNAQVVNGRCQCPANEYLGSGGPIGSSCVTCLPGAMPNPDLNARITRPCINCGAGVYSASQKYCVCASNAGPDNTNHACNCYSGYIYDPTTNSCNINPSLIPAPNPSGHSRRRARRKNVAAHEASSPAISYTVSTKLADRAASGGVSADALSEQTESAPLDNGGEAFNPRSRKPYSGIPVYGGHVRVHSDSKAITRLDSAEYYRYAAPAENVGKREDVRSLVKRHEERQKRGRRDTWA